MKEEQRARIALKAPATTANLGPGFDVFGMALERPGDRVLIEKAPEGIRIEVSGLSSGSIPVNPRKNTAGVAAESILREFSIKSGLSIKIEKGIPPGKGLGSSAAPAAAVAFGLNEIFNLGLGQNELIKFAAKGEAASAGVEHADNVSAAICGGFVIIKSCDPLEVIRMDPPENMEICVAIPEIRTSANKTEKARSVLPKDVPMRKAVQNVGSATAMVAGFAKGDAALVGSAMCDAIVEPARAFMIPGYGKIRENAIRAGACGVAISGAGPTMLAIVDSKNADAKKVAAAMGDGFASAGIKCSAFSTRPGKGVSIIPGAGK